MSGVYISFPFCAQKCSFCNFASGVFPRQLEQDYLRALTAEIRSHSWSWQPETLYLGGGTPSRIDAQNLSSILSAVPGRPWREATIEAAPGTFDAAAVRSWVDAGVDRVSLGVQSFVTAELRATGRRHDAAVVLRGVNTLRAHGLTNINIDLIAGLPCQSAETWNVSLDWIDRLAPPHVSVYMFEIDEDSRLGLEVLQGGSRYGAASLPAADAAADFYETAVERLHRAGIERYEISNFAVPGRESLHNLKYWLLEPYAGFGADAHSFDGGRRWGNVESAAEYVAQWNSGAGVRREAVDAVPQEERFFVGLRLMQGMVPTPEDWERYGGSIRRLRESGLLELNTGRIRLTPRGVLLSNEVFEEFID